MTDGTGDTNPRARSPRMARDERRAQVLRIAQELFSSEGFHHVSMDDIADRAEVSKPVLYRHFPSKLDLYLAVVDQNGADLLVAVETAVSAIEQGPVRRGDGRDVISAIVEAYVMFVEGAGESSALLFESDVTHDADVRARVERASSEAARRIAVVLSQVTALPLEEASILAVSLISMAQGAATYRLRQPTEVSAERTVHLVTQVAWGGVSALIRPDFVYEDA
ncbi:TetR/AcrR family transcriptional regulator [Cellulomonas sp. zg-ZUI188]|uniref:TetR/AcrR family transcriptional regulator n=2 Tax=Cellulomonas fengjieae TaxID=2819978 RepID=A0ABS3SD79_9CELL|nr:TetR/AcrR family transcriptional regulator [Cellulomonas fengjieae]MBO3101538.1 TetR/AcrR family transcriptional regulator [Cellulomonas fengjieae]QVI64984.1 TetR/AcrR family transcriptional regulator [Cellulomonas fengjieae]